MKRILFLTAVLLVAATALAQIPQIPGNGHAMLKIHVTGRYLLLPVQEGVNNAAVQVISGGEQLQSFNVRLAADKVDYYVPLDIARFGKEELLLDIIFRGERTSWKGMNAGKESGKAILSIRGTGRGSVPYTTILRFMDG